MYKILKILSLANILIWGGCATPKSELTLVEGGESRAPIVVAEDLSPRTLAAVDELAGYIEQISGARPEILTGRPDPLPQHAIWIGYQPVLDQVFPRVNFQFDQPEEVLIHADGRNVVIAGRDVWNPQVTEVMGSHHAIENPQQEYGTINAIYTFLPDWLGVYWLWPGELGTEVPQAETIAIPRIDYRYAPQLRARNGLFYRYMFGGRFAETSEAMEWFRHQRLLLDSLEFAGGHAFTHWAEKYHDEYPEYFALQPDGTRPIFPDARTVKLCHSNPEVWQRWMEDVARQIEKNPLKTVFHASPNDGYTTGHCVCEDCLAWDHPEAEQFVFIWQGASQRYVALTDREVRFANELARMLKETYPDKEYYVQIHAYGYSRPAPKGIVPADNVLISSVANFHLLGDENERAVQQKQDYADWAEVAPHLMWRPNVGNAVGRQTGMPLLSVDQTVADFRYVAERNAKGIFFDTMWAHWSNQGPYYYLLVHLAWNPWLDADALMERYYQAAFGPAAGVMANYWQLLSDTREAAFAAQGDGLPYTEFFTDALFEQANLYLDEAAAITEGVPGKYAERIEFVRDGLICAEGIVACRRWMIQFEESNGADEEARDAVLAIWQEMQEKRKGFRPHAVDGIVAFGSPRNSRMSGLHPDNRAPRTSRISAARAAQLKDAQLIPAEEAGWAPLFVDDFDRDELGDHWEIEEGQWTVDGGYLRGDGILFSAAGLPDGQVGYLRMEFDVMTDLEAVQMSPDSPPAVPSPNDFSSFIHSIDPRQSGVNALRTGYFFQFGGYFNQRNRIARNFEPVITTMSEGVIEVDKPYTIVVENDVGVLRFWVNGELLFEETDPAPIIGGDNDRYGLFFMTKAKVSQVRVYIKRIEAGYDMD